MKFLNDFQKFMYGRYGADELSKYLLCTYLVLIIVNIFFENTFLLILELIILMIVFYRFFSKKTYKRSRENAKFIKIKNNLFNFFDDFKKKKTNKYYVYKKCHKCKTLLKLPIPDSRGIKHVVCPKCKNRNSFLILKKTKVEFIKKKK